MKSLFVQLFIFSILSIGSSITSLAQNSPLQGDAVLLSFGYGHGVTYGDMSDRYQDAGIPAFEIEYFMHKSNFSLILSGSALFSQIVNENILEPLIINNFIVGNDRANAIISLDMRGLTLSGGVGYTIPFKSKNSLNGIKISTSLGWMQHRIRIQDDTRTVIQLSEPYNKGYDRLTGGFMVRNQIAYKYMASNRRINFEIGVRNMMGLTKNLRGFNYDTASSTEGSRFDGLISFYGTFSIPIYFNSSSEEIYY